MPSIAQILDRPPVPVLPGQISLEAPELEPDADDAPESEPEETAEPEPAPELAPVEDTPDAED